MSSILLEGYKKEGALYVFRVLRSVIEWVLRKKRFSRKTDAGGDLYMLCKSEKVTRRN